MKLQLRYSFFILFCFLVSASVYAQNPPRAIINTAPNLVGNDYEFTINLSPSLGNDCYGNIFEYSCNNNKGLQNVKIYWFLYAIQDCAGCNLDSSLLNSGIIDHGFWGTNCIENNIEVGTNCTSPGGCNNILKLNNFYFCSGATYKIITYAFNPDYTKGLKENSTTSGGPYRCCEGDPPIGNLSGMQTCNNWLNPSRPQIYTFVSSKPPLTPSLNINANIQNGSTINCGHNLNTTFDVSGLCLITKAKYRVLLNSVEVANGTSDCFLETASFTYNATVIGCPDSPTCTPNANEIKANCGINNILRFEVFQDCSSTPIVNQEINFTLACPEPDNLAVNVADGILCYGESSTVSVVMPANIVNPYPTGTYHIFWNNNNAYNAPTQNHLGAGTSLNFTNNGTFPYNTPIEMVGTIWQNYPSTAPAGCETFSGTASVVMLKSLSLNDALQASCDYGKLKVIASGGYPGYNTASLYSYNATSAGAGINNTGEFLNVAPGTYSISVSDAQGCSASVMARAFAPLNITATAQSCSSGVIEIANANGGFDPTIFNNAAPYSIYLSTSPAPGVPGSVNSTPATLSSNGMFSNVPIGSYYVVIKDGFNCSYSVPVTISPKPVISQSTQVCNAGTITVTAQGGTPDYTFYLYNSNGTFNPQQPESLANGWIASDIANGSGNDASATFNNLNNIEYQVFALDANGCPAIPSLVQVPLQTLSISLESLPCNYGTVFSEAVGGVLPYTYKLLNNLNNTVATNTTNGDFSNLNNGIYKVSVTDNLGCTAITNTYVVSQQPMNIGTPYSCYEGFEASGGAGLPYTYQLYSIGNNSQLIASNADGKFTVPDANYTLKITDSNNCTFETQVSCENTPLPCNFTAMAETQCIDGLNYNVLLTLNGSSSYTISDGIHPNLNNQSGGIKTIGAFANGNYNITITDQNNATCSKTISGSKNCFTCNTTASITSTCANAFTFAATLTFSGDGLYTINDGVHAPISNLSSGNINLGTFVNGSYSVSIISQTDPTCIKNIAFTKDCFTCNLNASLNSTCVNFSSFNASLSLTGNGTYTIADGVHPNKTNQNPGNISLGLFNNGNYTVTVTNQNTPSCSQTLALSQNCFVCNVTASAVPICIDATSYNVSLTFSGNGLYTISSGNQTYSNQSSGTIIIGPFTNNNYNITITSQIDPSCNKSISGTKNCFTCNLDAIASTTCIDDETFNAFLTIVGAGSYTVSDGIHAPQNNITAGSLNLGLFNNGSYSVLITSEIDPTCKKTVTINKDCFVCNLQAQVSTNCINTNQFNAIVNISGNGTFSVNDGVHPIQSNVLAGNLNLGNFNNGSYEVSIISNINPTCAKTISFNKNCFTCDLLVNYNVYCIDFQTYEVEISFSGSGQYAITDGVHAPKVNLNAGIYTVGPFNNNNNFVINVTSQTDLSCNQKITGSSENCFECLLPTTSTVQCVTANSYKVAFNIPGEGFFTIKDGIHAPQTASAGVFVTPLLTLPNYSITITATTDPTCTTVLQGVANCTPPPTCDLATILSYECINENQFNALLTVSGTGLFTINDGVHAPLINKTAGVYTLGPLLNGAYSISIVNQVIADCEKTLSGTYSCEVPFTCDASLSATVTCIDNIFYNLDVNLQGKGTYTITDGGIHAPINNLNQGTYNIGFFTNGSYTLTATSEIDSTCKVSVSGINTCQPDPVCELSANILNIFCTNEELYCATIAINGTGIFNVTSNGNSNNLSNVTAGNYNLCFANGNYNINIISLNDTTCTAQLSGVKNCTNNNPCNLTVAVNINCNETTFLNELAITIPNDALYTLKNDALGTINNLKDSTILINYPSETPYFATLIKQNDTTCQATVNGITPYCLPICNLLAAPQFSCTEDSSQYSIELNYSGTSTYHINTNQNNNANIWNNNDAYEISVIDDKNPNCKQTFSGTYSCLPEPSCSFTVKVAPVCINPQNNEYDLEINLIGAGTYRIHNNQDGTDLINQTQGIITLSGQNGLTFDITIYNQNINNCKQTFTGATICQIPPKICSVNAVIFAECADQEILIKAEFADTGKYLIYSGLYFDYLNGNSQFLQEATISSPNTIINIGFSEPNTAYYFTIINKSDTTCFVDFIGTQQCNDECYILAEFEKICTSDSTYTLLIKASNSDADFFEYIVKVNDQSGFLVLDTIITINTPQDVVILNTTNIGTVESHVTIYPVDNVFCLKDFYFHNTCYVPPVCDLGLNVYQQCNDDNTYGLQIAITGTSGYIVNYGQGTLNNVAAGTYTVNPLTANNYQVQVIDTANINCTAYRSGSNSCNPPFICNLSANATTICNADNTFAVTITLSGQGLYNIKSNAGNLTNVDEGTYLLSPFTGTTYSILIENKYDITCNTTLSGEITCKAPADCNFNALLTTVCTDENTFNALINITGDGTFSINDNVHPVQNNLSAGNYTLNGFLNGNYNITVTNSEVNNCEKNFAGSFDCTPTPINCDVQISTKTQCSSLDSYSLNLIINGSDQYNVKNNNVLALSNISQGSYTLPNIPNGNYSLEVISVQNSNCFQNINGSNNCNPQNTCTLTALVTNFNCLSEDAFSITLNISGNSQYTIDYGLDQLPLMHQTAGQITLSPFINGAYNITISDENNTNCYQTLSGFYNCSHADTCNTSIVPKINCTQNGKFNFDIILNGSSLYTIIDGVHENKTNISAGSINLGTFDSGNYQVEVIDQNNPNCSIYLEGNYICNLPFATINGFVFNDNNNNGLYASTEFGLANITVILYNLNGIAIDTAYTNINGQYTFTNLPANIYYVSVQYPAGYQSVPQNIGNNFFDEIDSDVNANGISDLISASIGSIINHLDAGMFKQACSNFEVQYTTFCPDADTIDNYTIEQNYELAIAIDGGLAPYTIHLDVYDGIENILDTSFIYQAYHNIKNFTKKNNKYTAYVVDANGCLSTSYQDSVYCTYSLPITLLNFTGKAQEQFNVLQWVSSAEVNNNFYTLYHSINGINFTPLANITGSGTSLQTHYYGFNHTLVSNGLHYYRLAQTDFNGKETLLKTITILRNQETPDLQVLNLYPNPTTTDLQIRCLSKTTQNATILVFDVTGRCVLQHYAQLQVGINTINLPTKTIANGVYLLKVSNNNNTLHQKFVKQ